jgi:MFS family permease
MALFGGYEAVSKRMRLDLALMKQKFVLFRNLAIPNDLREDLSRIAWGVSLGFVFFVCLNGAPFAGFVRHLGVGDFMYGVLMGLPVMSGLFQMMAAYVLEKTGARKKLFMIGGVLQRLSIIPVVILPLIIPNELKGLTIGLIVFFLLVSAVGGAFNGVTFISWMAALVPLKVRGRFFSQRQMMFTFTGLIGGLLASYALDLIDGFVGFAVVFSIVTVFALLDIMCFIRVYDPPMVKPQYKISIKKITNEVLQHPNYRRFLIFWAVWVFGVNISGPFFSAYMLDYLKMSYLEITIYTQMVSNLLTILVVKKWGGLIDVFGNKPVLRICGTVAAVLPLFWLFATPENYIAIPLIHVATGLFWNGIDLTSNNLIMALSPDENRSFYIATSSMVTSIVGSILAYALGGLFMELTGKWIDGLNIIILGRRLINYHMLFILSSLIRFIGITFLLSPIKEEESANTREVLQRSIQAVGVYRKNIGNWRKFRL